jgi:hypothetical protein
MGGVRWGVGQVSEFKFLTRLHYCAPDVDTHGRNAEWGEHEVSVNAVGMWIVDWYSTSIPLDTSARTRLFFRWITFSSSRRRWM